MGSLAYMLECATNSKLSNTEHTKTMVSSLWLMCWYMSGSLCTSAGSKAYDLLGFGWSCFLEAVILFIPVCWMFGNVISSKLQSVVNQTITTESEDEDDKDLKTKLILPI
ncbi:uncharacterized protein LOC111705682 [Eurytemora carolleeae]|uniref:uncharacterized protein LOC111705682 n=1 Tax=Eurytemora carolleeae TaxID=1294199 RepID=UPI000C75A689|nr:uncharacterized protein LOC111705682 [Eurytemora carolleeae]|eukprot:XP_023334079.1 uncharacterized protein LOC111705682 [Eurytemora affinis]